jgi:hypothetical protein
VLGFRVRMTKDYLQTELSKRGWRREVRGKKNPHIEIWDNTIINKSYLLMRTNKYLIK